MGEAPLKYTATLKMVAGSYVLEGTRSTEGVGGPDGTFRCELHSNESSSSSSSSSSSGGGMLSGLFLGEAAPDPSLVATVPRNPIKWVLAQLPATTITGEIAQASAVIGAGYFDDSGDFPGDSVLYFFVRGVIQPDGRVLLDKVYERKTGNLTVNYTGLAHVESGGSTVVLSGSWSNGSEQTHGLFAAMEETPFSVLPPVA